MTSPTKRACCQSWPEGGPRLLWKIDKLGRGWSSPMIVGDRLYITGDVGDESAHLLLRPRRQTAVESEKRRRLDGSLSGCPGVLRRTSEGKLYHMNAHGRVACLDAATGKEVWAVNVLERFEGRNITWAMSECLLVDGPRLIVTPGGQKALMAALDKGNGQTIWTTESAPRRPGFARFADSVSLRRTPHPVELLVGHGFGVDADTGKLLWTVPLRNNYGTNITTPVFGGGSIFYVTAIRFRRRATGCSRKIRHSGRKSLDDHAGQLHRRSAA